MLTLLHIEDDDGDAMQVLRDCKKEFGIDGFSLVRVNSMKNALLKLKENSFDTVLLDLNLGDGRSIENIEAIKEKAADMPIVVLSGHDDTETALLAIRNGAQEYIIKSVNNARQLGLAVLASIERKAYERHLYHLANHDELTGLPNRRAFKDYLKPWLIRASRWQRTETVMFMDVNGFKQVNDTLGHDVGDLLLKQISAILRSGLRASDMLARYAGDEFVVHLDTDAKDPKALSERVAGKINKFFEEPIMIGGHSIKTSVSIGIASFPRDGLDVSSLIHHADLAMYDSKTAGKPFSFYDMENAMSAKTEQREKS
mgnify:CR=1 FL=1